jgi:hypothetical protein
MSDERVIGPDFEKLFRSTGAEVSSQSRERHGGSAPD